MCGCGAATLIQTEEGWVTLAGFGAGIVGPQTVPRAELTAICILLECVVTKQIEIVVDADYIFKGIHRGRRGTNLGCHIDLWTRFWDLIDQRGGDQNGDLHQSHLPPL